MAFRRNFSDPDNSIVEQNRRFDKSDLEKNLNQLFSGGGRGNFCESASVPAREQSIPGDRFSTHSSNSSGHNVMNNYAPTSSHARQQFQQSSYNQQQVRNDNQSWNRHSAYKNDNLFQRRDKRDNDHVNNEIQGRGDGFRESNIDRSNFGNNDYQRRGNDFRNNEKSEMYINRGYDNLNFKSNDAQMHGNGFRSNISNEIQSRGAGFRESNNDRSNFGNNDYQMDINSGYNSNFRNTQQTMHNYETGFQSGQKRPYADINRPNASSSGNTNFKNTIQKGNFGKAPRIDTSNQITMLNPTTSNGGQQKRKKKGKDAGYIRRAQNANNIKRERKAAKESGQIKKVPKGKLKAEPEKYWPEWWSKYAYIEKTIDRYDKNDKEIYDKINFTLDATSKDFDAKKKLLLKVGTGKIRRTLFIEEDNYMFRDVYKFFIYKPLLEDINFQKHLTPKEKIPVREVLHLLQKSQRKLALVNQSLIHRWHNSRNMLEGNDTHYGDRHAKKLMSDKLFHFLVFEAIQDLKELTAEDWPGFVQFYKTL